MLLNKELKKWFDSCYWNAEEAEGFAFNLIIDLYYYVDYYEYDDGTQLSFPQKRQLFLELVRYYMEKGWLRFEGEYLQYKEMYWDKDKRAHYPNSQTVFWSKDTSIDDTLSYFESRFPREFLDNSYVAGKKNYRTLAVFFYCDAPPAYWWDEEEKEWVVGD